MSVQAGERDLCVKMQLLFESVPHFGMVRNKGNLRDVNMARVPFLMLTHLVQTAD